MAVPPRCGVEILMDATDRTKRMRLQRIRQEKFTLLSLYIFEASCKDRREAADIYLKAL